MTLLEKMDRAVYATGIDRILFRKIQPRTFRWWPLIVLATLMIGYVLMARAGKIVDELLIGAALFYGACLLAFTLRIFGPRMTPTIDQPLDERELTVKARANAGSGTILATGAMLFCFYMAVPDVLHLWRPISLNDWLALGFGLQACHALLPTLIASWLEPRAIADDED